MRTYEVELTIPDNTAFTALGALQRLGISSDEIRRTDIYCFDVDAAQVGALDASVRSIETIYNPNKHRLAIVTQRPAGEVWIGDRADDARRAAKTQPTMSGERNIVIAGRRLAGVRSVSRATAWRLRRGGQDVAPEVLAKATAMLLCNPAFQEVVEFET